MSLNYNYIYFGIISGMVEHTLSFIPRNILDFIQTDTNINMNKYIENIIKQRNYFRIMKGYYPMMISVGFAHIPLFYCYDMNKNTDSIYNNFLYGSLGKIAHDIIMCPGDTIRMHCNLLNISGYNSTKIILKKGPSYFFKGLPISLLISIPGGGMEFLIINRFERLEYNKNNIVLKFIPGFIGGSLTSILLTPFDYLKTQMQIQGSEINKYKIYKSNIKNHLFLLNKYYSNVGFRGLFRGCFIRGFNSAICYGTYEVLSSVYKIN